MSLTESSVNFGVVVSNIETAPVVKLLGDIDHATKDVVTAALRPVVEPKPPGVVVDCSRFEIRGGSEILKRMISILGIDELLRVTDSQDGISATLPVPELGLRALVAQLSKRTRSSDSRFARPSSPSSRSNGPLLGRAGAMERSEDGRWVIVDGRRWRATDPDIPDALRSELVAELMDARRSVGAAKRADDGEAEADARRRVDRAKIALGERGRPWWEIDRRAPDPDRIRATLLALTRHRATGSVCPSDVARAVGAGAWRGLMDAVRDVVRVAILDGEVVATQGETVLDPDDEWRGPIRIRLRQ